MNLQTLTDSDLKWHLDGYKKVLQTGKDARGRVRSELDLRELRSIVQQLEAERERREKALVE